MSNTSLLGSFGGQGDSSLMFRNRIINGDMRIWQRGTSGSSGANQVGGYGSADRWKFVAHQGLVNYVSGTLDRSTDVPAGALYSAKAVSTAAGLDDFVVGQIIESANSFDLVGKPVTFSVQMKKLATLTGKTLTMEIGYLNAVDTTPSDWLNNVGITVVSSRIINSADFATAWGQYTLTTGVLPAQAANGLVVRLCLRGNDLGSGDLFAFTEASLEAGPTATPFERRPIGMELALCQRYFFRTTDWVHGASATAPGGSYGAHIFNFTFPVTLRRVPTFSVESISNGGTGTNYTTADFLSKVSQTYRSTTNAYLEMNVSALAGTVTAFLMLNGMRFDAEL